MLDEYLKQFPDDQEIDSLINLSDAEKNLLRYFEWKESPVKHV
jgi:hypothetical protein